MIMENMAEGRIRVLVADDHAIVREGICALLKAQPDITVIGEAPDGYEALAKVQELHPDIVLMDLAMPNMSGLVATQRIKEESPQTQVLALTVHEDEEYFYGALAAGASGYLLKGVISSELVAAIRAVHQGKVYIDPSIAGKLVTTCIRGMRSGDERQGLDSLTKREREVLKLIGEGRTNQEIADILYLSPNTVQTHRSRIMDKLKLQNRAELIKFALHKGLVDLDK